MKQPPAPAPAPADGPSRADRSPAAPTAQTVRLFASDLDGTLLGNPDSALDFAASWRKAVAVAPGARPLLCYNTGRMRDEALEVVAQASLPRPDYLISAVGTAIDDLTADEPRSLGAFAAELEAGWNRRAADACVRSSLPAAEPQDERYQSAFKSSWHLYSATPEQLSGLGEALARAGVAACVIYSSGRDLDILPAAADKGKALAWLLRHLGIPPEATLVAGDSGNDTPMFLLPGARGIVVANAQPELLEATVGLPAFRAAGGHAAGVLQGLLRFGVIPKVVQTQPIAHSDGHHDREIQQLFRHEEIGPETGRQQRLLDLAFEKAVDALRRCATPMGFSACSLADNEPTGTDANYHSVWGRDGAITVIGSIGLRDPQLRSCQRATLETLLDHISLPGQIPSNVRIETGEPDYSGVGGIASIDSGLWVVIACHDYVVATGDSGFLDRYSERLQRVMNWLSAHDSNNDALIEIPEAGDWMDLFNRSYNVLYDEVLWYRANVCFAALLEAQGELGRARDYLHWAQRIKNAILDRFQPRTRPGGGAEGEAGTGAGAAARTFADTQFSLGDAPYLLAQVSPFAFDWRCDVYANLLALIYNVVDLESARTAFRFMWGVGVNEPYPVKNLYPPVGAGDPDWKHYYTVNLLNLPQHYHNGGIWPFIGGLWARYIHRLGLNDVARSELVKLAELNRKGTAGEWEFNEWAHGGTGRPMGKAFQAWSAAEFIAAYREIVGGGETGEEDDGDT